MSQKKSKVAAHVLLVTDAHYLPVLLELLDRARSKIHILAYSFAMASASGKIDTRGAPFQIAEKLMEIKKRCGSKIDIRLYIEGRRDTSERNRVTAEILKKSGVKIKYGATHAKGFCIDDKYVLLGSTNLTNQSLVKNNETNVLLDQKDVAFEFNRYFEHLWVGGEHGGITLQPPLLADGAFKDVLVQMIDSAKKYLEFSIYFFDHKEIAAALIRAHERKVKITGFVHQHGSFALSYVRRTRKTVALLREAGLRDLHFASGSLFTHSKYLIKDRSEVALGTGNWLREDVEIHPQLYIHLKDPSLASQLSRHLRAQIKEQRTED